MGVGDGADLVVSEVSGPASASNGQNFTAYASMHQPYASVGSVFLWRLRRHGARPA